MGISENIFLLASRSQKLAQKLSHFHPVQRGVSRFMPGETVKEAFAAAEILQDDGISTLMTYLGENVTTRSESERVTSLYRGIVESVNERDLDCQISVKPTQLGLDVDDELCFSNILSLVEHASRLASFVWIDMESYSCAGPTLDMYCRLRTDHSNVGVCLQSYLYRTSKDLENLLVLSPAIRLVKGAYAESPAVAFRKKRDVDRNFLSLTEPLLNRAQEGTVLPAIATHDPRLVHHIQQELARRGMPKGSVEFQMLYGVRREDQLQLARDGYRIRVLISYGSAWFPWYMRRLAERPANFVFVLRNLFVR